MAVIDIKLYFSFLGNFDLQEGEVVTRFFGEGGMKLGEAGFPQLFGKKIHDP